MTSNICKLIVSYHKPSRIFNDPLYLPVNAGRSLLDQKYNQGLMSFSEKQWLLQNTIGDDTGDNISDLNYSFCELTAIYWVWKNYDRIGSPDYIGFCHYRRIFDVDSDTIEQFIGTNQVIYAGYEKIEKDFSVYQQFCKWHKSDLDLCLDFFASNNSNFYLYLKEYLALPFDNSALYNMFIVQKEIFFEYCELLFELLFELKSKLNLANYSFYGSRVFGFIAERITGAFFYYKYKIGFKIKKSVPFFLDEKYIKISLNTYFSNKFEVIDILTLIEKPASNKKKINIVMPLDTDNLEMTIMTFRSCVINSSAGNSYRVVLMCNIDRNRDNNLYYSVKNKITTVLNGNTNFEVSFVILSETLICGFDEDSAIKIKNNKSLWFLLINNSVCDGDVIWVNSGYLFGYGFSSFTSLVGDVDLPLKGCESYGYYVAEISHNKLQDNMVDFSKQNNCMQTNFLSFNVAWLNNNKKLVSKNIVVMDGACAINVECFKENVYFLDYYWSVETNVSFEYDSIDRKLSFDKYMKFSAYCVNWKGAVVKEINRSILKKLGLIDCICF